MWSNYHTHTFYCDGKGTVADYIAACRTQGVAQIGFSSHAPLPFPCKWCIDPKSLAAYLRDIREARQANPDVEVYSGLEIDYIPTLISPSQFASKLDYTVGSVHFVGAFEGTHWEIDNTQTVFDEGLKKVFGGDIRAAISAYYDLTCQMLRESPPDILGHMDKIKINATRYSSEEESWYIEAIEKTIRTAAETSTIVEVNTRGLYKKKSTTPYPSPWILERLRHARVPVTISSDAHNTHDLTNGFSSTHRLCRTSDSKTFIY